MTGRWQRMGALSGILFFLLVIASFFTPETPDPDDSSVQIATAIADDRTGHLLSVYLQGLGSLLFLVFVVALWSRIRAAETAHGPTILVALGGMGTAVLILVVNGIFLALIEAADTGREPEAVRALFELDDMFFLITGWMLAAFYTGIALSSLITGSLPRWLGWTAAGLVVAFVIGFLGVFAEDDEGGALGALFFLAYIVNFLWILAASILMLRSSSAAARTPT